MCRDVTSSRRDHRVFFHEPADVVHNLLYSDSSGQTHRLLCRVRVRVSVSGLVWWWDHIAG